MSKSKVISGANLKVYFFIESFIKKQGYNPTVREIAKGVKLNSPSTVQSHLERLKKYNFINWVEGKNRTIQIVNE